MVFVEQDGGEIEESSLGVLTRAREVAERRGYEVYALLPTARHGPEEAKELGAYGAHVVVLARHEALDRYHSEAYAAAVAQAVEAYDPEVLLASATRNGRDLLARLAVRFRTGLMAHVIEFDVGDDGRLVGTVPGFGGSIAAVVKHVRGRPQMSTVSPGAYQPARRWGPARVEELRPSIGGLRVRVLERRVGEARDISRAPRVVVAGMGAAQALDLVRELAELLGAELGVTRPLADAGLAPRDVQVGSTGVSLRSDLVLVLGASGAPHFVSGIREAGTVVSVNVDPEAPIREHSDYFAVADLNELLPILIRELRRRLGGGGGP